MLKKVNKINKCFFYVVNTKNNLRLIFMGPKNKVIVEFSAKSLYDNRWDRKSKDALDTLLWFFFTRYKKTLSISRKKIKNCGIRLVGSRLIFFRNNLRSIVFHLRRLNLNIISIEDFSPVVHNGCRLRKKKR